MAATGETHETLAGDGAQVTPAATTPRVWIIVPVYNEREALPASLEALRPFTQSAALLFVDGGSEDRTVEWLREQGLAVISAEKGRGSQLRAGAMTALLQPGCDVLWFVHADCRPAADAPAQILQAVEGGAVAGACTVRFWGGFAARVMTGVYAILNRLGLFYGDSALFIRAETYRECGGFQPLPLFEDLDLLRRIRARWPGGFKRIPAEVLVSSRRFEGFRFVFVFAQWCILQILYWCGVSPRRLAQWYRAVR